MSKESVELRNLRADRDRLFEACKDALAVLKSIEGQNQNADFLIARIERIVAEASK